MCRRLSHYFSPTTIVYAGEPEGAADAILSIKNGKIEKAPYVKTIADGLQLINKTSFDRNYIQFFPSSFLSYQFSDKHEIHGSYSRRIDRPGYQQLNPFRYFIDPYSYMEGNPFLQPQLTNAYEFSYTFMKLYTVTFNYSHTMQAMTQITKQIDSTRTTFVTTENLDANDNYGIGVSLPFTFASWWQ